MASAPRRTPPLRYFLMVVASRRCQCAHPHAPTWVTSLAAQGASAGPRAHRTAIASGPQRALPKLCRAEARSPIFQLAEQSRDGVSTAAFHGGVVLGVALNAARCVCCVPSDVCDGFSAKCFVCRSAALAYGLCVRLSSAPDVSALCGCCVLSGQAEPNWLRLSRVASCPVRESGRRRQGGVWFS